MSTAGIRGRGLTTPYSGVLGGEILLNYRTKDVKDQQNPQD